MVVSIYSDFANTLMDVAKKKLDEAQRCLDEAKEYQGMANEWMERGDSIDEWEVHQFVKEIKKKEKIKNCDFADKIGTKEDYFKRTFYQTKNISLHTADRWVRGLDGVLCIVRKGKIYQLAEVPYDRTSRGNWNVGKMRDFFKRHMDVKDEDAEVWFE